MTALMYAVENLNVEAVRILAPLEYNLKDNRGMTALKILESFDNDQDTVIGRFMMF